MRAINHAATGAIIGLTVTAPAIALPLAFLSHFALDALPHFDDYAKYPENSRAFARLLVADALLCVLLVVYLFFSLPGGWLIPSLGAFLATSPDLMWVTKFIKAQRTGMIEKNPKSPILRFHSRIQWRTSPEGIYIELAWLAISVYLIIALTV